MGDPPRMRKSLLSQQAAKEGLSFNSSNVDGLLQDLPKNLKLNAANNRGRNVSSRGRGGSMKTPSLVTPVSRGMVPRSGTASSCGIPRPTARTLQVGGSGTTGAGTRGRPAGARPPTANTGRNATARFQTSSTRSTLSRTMSVDSLADYTMNGFRTPRARSRSPGSAAKDRSTVTKLVAPPKDKQSLSLMTEKILEVSSALGYPQELTPAEFRASGGTGLQKMFSFFLNIMVGPNNGKDEVAYLSDSLTMLECPVTTLKSSQLKTLSVPHVQPQAITALCWLACYVEDFMGLRTDNQPDICDDNQAVENETWDTYKRLFFCQLSNGEVNLEEELDNYRSRLVGIYDDCPDTSLDDLKQELEEKLERKEKLFAQEDPRAEVLNVIHGQNEILEKEEKRLAELETKLNKFTNLTALQSDEAHYESTLARLQRELASVKDAVNGQKISKVDAERKVNEIADMKKQQDSLQVVLENLQKKLHNQEQFLRNDQKRFHEVCCGFSVIEQFNNAAKNWSDIVPRLEKNPFDVAAMQTWLRNVKQKLVASKRLLERRHEHYSEEEKVCASVCETLDANLNALEDECNRIDSELSFQGHEQQHKMDQVSEELQRVEQELHDAVRVVGQLTSEIEARKKDLAELEKVNEADAKLIDELTAKATEIDTRVERTHGQSKLAEVEVQEYLLAFVVDARSKVNANLAKLNDPEFRRQVLAKRSASKTDGGGCSTNTKGGSDKDSNEAA